MKKVVKKLIDKSVGKTGDKLGSVLFNGKAYPLSDDIAGIANLY